MKPGRPGTDQRVQLDAAVENLNRGWGKPAQALAIGAQNETHRVTAVQLNIVPKLSVADGINTVRTLYPTMWFDKEKCADGLQSLRYYHYEVHPNSDQFSHNAFTTLHRMGPMR